MQDFLCSLYSTGEKGGHETSSEDKCERDGPSAKNNNSCSDSCRVNDRRRTITLPLVVATVQEIRNRELFHARKWQEKNTQEFNGCKTKQGETCSTRMGIR